MKKSPFIAGPPACGTLYGQKPDRSAGSIPGRSRRTPMEGRLYLYVSRDESPDHYCSWSYDPLSTSDLKNWKITKTLSPRGPNDQVPVQRRRTLPLRRRLQKRQILLYYSMRTRSTKACLNGLSNSPDRTRVKNGQPMKGISQDRPGGLRRRRRTGVLTGATFGPGIN